MTARSFPLDLEDSPYPYVERPNRVVVELLRKHVLQVKRDAAILDVGCGAGAHVEAIRSIAPDASWTGIEPAAQAATQAREVMQEVFPGTMEEWLRTSRSQRYDAVVLSDVVEHVADPVRWLRSLVEDSAVRNATFVVSIPNYAVWYNRWNTLLGRFRYQTSGLYDRTHLRFYTRETIRELFEYCGLRIFEERCTPSVVQSMAPLLRRFYEGDIARGEHRALTRSPLFGLYSTAIEPAEAAVCRLWPELLGFQIVFAARVVTG